MLKEEPDFIKESESISYITDLSLWLKVCIERDFRVERTATKNPHEEVNSGEPVRCVR